MKNERVFEKGRPPPPPKKKVAAKRIKIPVVHDRVTSSPLLVFLMRFKTRLRERYGGE